MGDPKKIRKKYQTPSHPWIKNRIDSEKKLTREFGTQNKKEIWKMETILKNFKTQAKKLLALTSNQAKVETQHLFRRVKELNLVTGEATFDQVLGLEIEDVMARRLQTIVFKKGLARTIKQARQFIVHEHILVGDKKITSPSYLVSVLEESSVSFAVSSPLISEDHPERASLEKLAEVRAQQELLAKQAAEEAARKAEREAREKAEGIEEVPPVEEDIKKTEEEETKKIPDAEKKEAESQAKEKKEKIPDAEKKEAESQAKEKKEKIQSDEKPSDVKTNNPSKEETP